MSTSGGAVGVVPLPVGIAAGGTGQVAAPAALAALGGIDATALLGRPVYREFGFAWNSANLTTGLALYVPTVGDYLIDAHIFVTNAWDGITPTGDYGLFTAGVPKPGFLNTIGTAIAVPSLQDMTSVTAVNALGMLGDNLGNNDLAALSSYLLTQQFVPVKFATVDPVCVCVTQNGLPGGAAPGQTQGTALLLLVTATPV